MARSAGTWVIVLTFLVALVLSAIPMAESLQWWRPEWGLLVLLYWVVALPQRVGIGVGWVFGILLDVLEGSLLGINALELTVAAYFTLLFYQRLRMYNWVQQSLFVFMLAVMTQVLSLWFKGILGVSAQSLMFLLPALISALLWPWIFMLMRGVRRNFNVY